MALVDPNASNYNDSNELEDEEFVFRKIDTIFIHLRAESMFLRI